MDRWIPFPDIFLMNDQDELVRKQQMPVQKPNDFTFLHSKEKSFKKKVYYII